MRLIFLPVLFLALPSFSECSFQQQWTDGPGIYGPEPYWYEGFWQSSGVAWWELTPGWDGIHRIQLIHYQMTTVASDFEDATSLDPVDIDGDGDPDVLACSSAGNEIAWWCNEDGAGTAWSKFTVDDNFSGAVSVQGADMDGNGYLDIVGAARYDHEIALWRNLDGLGTSWSRHTILSDYDLPGSVEIGDIDGDGDLDVVCSSTGPNPIVWMENANGSGLVWREHTVSGSVLVTRAVDICDIDGDSDMDVLASTNGPDTSWWENIDGSGTSWQKHTIETVYFCFNDIAAADIDGDGFPDVIGTNDAGSWKVNWWRNIDGSGTQWVRVPIGGQALYAPGSSSIQPLDFDSDGDMDVVAASASENTVKVWMNADGAGTDWDRAYIQGAFYGAGGVSTTDFNSDGTPDVLALASDDGAVAWWKDTTFTESGWLESTIDRNVNAFYELLEASYDDPPGTSVLFQLRASDDSTDMGPWSDTLTAPYDLSKVIQDGDYLQYRIILATLDPEVTPVLSNISVYWGYTGMEEGSEGNSEGISGPLENPSCGPVTVLFSVMGTTQASFSLYDLTGRIVESIPAGSYTTGEYELVLGDLLPGMYTLRMQTDEYTDTCRIVVIGP